MKRLLALLAAAQLLSSCGDSIPKELEKAGDKEFWQNQITHCDCEDNSGVKTKMQEALNNSRLVVLSAKDDVYTVTAVSGQTLKGALVDNKNDTIGDVYYVHEYGTYNEKYKAETGEKSYISNMSSITLKGDYSTSIISEETNIFTEKSDIKKTSWCMIQ